MALLSGRYHLGDVVYDDGVVAVHRGHDQVLNRAVTIELLRPDAPGGMGEALGDKARRMALVELPNVAALYDQGDHEGRPYLVLEEVLGEPLVEAAPLAPPDTASLLSALVATLKAARARQALPPRMDGQSVRWTGDRVQILNWGAAPATPADDAALLGPLLALALTGSMSGMGSSTSLPAPLRGVVDRTLRGEFKAGREIEQALAGALRSADAPTEAVPRGRPTIMLPFPEEASPDRARSAPPAAPRRTEPRPARPAQAEAQFDGDAEPAVAASPRRRIVPWLLAGLLLLAALGAGSVWLRREPGRAGAETAAGTDAGTQPPAVSAVATTPAGSGTPFVVNTAGGTRLNVRSGPGQNYPEVGKLNNGVVVRVVEGPVTSGQFQWVRIESDQVSGWCVYGALRPG